MIICFITCIYTCVHNKVIFLLILYSDHRYLFVFRRRYNAILNDSLNACNEKTFVMIVLISRLYNFYISIFFLINVYILYNVNLYVLFAIFWFIFYFPLYFLFIFTLILFMNVLFSVVLLKINLLTLKMSPLTFATEHSWACHAVSFRFTCRPCESVNVWVSPRAATEE